MRQLAPSRRVSGAGETKVETEQLGYFWGMELVLALIALGVGISNLRWWQGLAMLAIPAGLWILFDVTKAGQALTSDGMTRRMLATTVLWRFGEVGLLFAAARGARLFYLRAKKAELERSRQRPRSSSHRPRG